MPIALFAAVLGAAPVWWRVRGQPELARLVLRFARPAMRFGLPKPFGVRCRVGKNVPLLEKQSFDEFR